MSIKTKIRTVFVVSTSNLEFVIAGLTRNPVFLKVYWMLDRVQHDGIKLMGQQ